jgi:hypothetical protein
LEAKEVERFNGGVFHSPRRHSCVIVLTRQGCRHRRLRHRACARTAHLIRDTQLATDSVIASSSSRVPGETTGGRHTVKRLPGRAKFKEVNVDGRFADASILIPLRGRARMRNLPPKRCCPSRSLRVVQRWRMNSLRVCVGLRTVRAGPASSVGKPLPQSHSDAETRKIFPQKLATVWVSRLFQDHCHVLKIQGS